MSSSEEEELQNRSCEYIEAGLMSQLSQQLGWRAASVGGLDDTIEVAPRPRL